MNTKINKKTLGFPMKLVQIYLSVVLILFIFGPWPWPINNRPYVILYILLAQFLLFLGFRISLSKKILIIKVSNRRSFFNLNKLCINKIILVSLVISMILMIPNYLARVGSMGFNVNDFFVSIVQGILNPGSQYHNKLLIVNESLNSTFLLTVNVLSAPLRWLLIPLTIVHGKKIKKSYKVGVFLVAFVELVSWISIGTNKGIFDLVFVIAFSVLLKMAIEGNFSSKVFQISKKNIKFIVLSGTLIAISLAYFTNAISSRLGKINTFNQAARIHVNFDSFIMMIAPKFMQEMIIAISSYTTQGYYGLSLAMGEKFDFTYGFGNSWFLMSLFEKITGNGSLKIMTYPFKIEKYGWDPYGNWHSIFTWLASDFTFIGTLLVIFIIGYFFGEIWKSCLYQRNIFAMGLFVLFMIMFMYFPANNQIFSFVNTFAAFWGLFLLWFFSAKIV